MGVASLGLVCAQLAQHGLPAQTPAAVIENVTLPTQRTVAGTLGTLPVLARVHAVRAPALVVIGEVVALHAQLAPRAGSAARAAALPSG